MKPRRRRNALRKGLFGIVREVSLGKQVSHVPAFGLLALRSLALSAGEEEVMRASKALVWNAEWSDL